MEILVMNENSNFDSTEIQAIENFNNTLIKDTIIEWWYCVFDMSKRPNIKKISMQLAYVVRENKSFIGDCIKNYDLYPSEKFGNELWEIYSNLILPNKVDITDKKYKRACISVFGEIFIELVLSVKIDHRYKGLANKLK